MWTSTASVLLFKFTIPVSWISLLILSTLPQCSFSVDTRCYQCSGITNPHNCGNIVTCKPGERCMTRAYISDGLSVLFDMKCAAEEFCSVVGKRDVSEYTENFNHTIDKNLMRSKRQYEIPLCVDCCTGEHCNGDLCPSSMISRPTALKCYECNRDLDDPADCLDVRVCGSDEKCSVTEKMTVGGPKFRVGCMSNGYCDAVKNNILFGKRADTQFCRACCDTDHCNIDYCSRVRPLPSSVATAGTNAPTSLSTTAATTVTTTIFTTPLIKVQGPYNLTREAMTAPVSFKCQVDGIPVPQYTWYFLDSTGKKTNVTSKAVLTGLTSLLDLGLVTPNDRGTYICEASNSVETLTQNGELIVYTKLSLTGPTLTDQQLKEGDNLTLHCNYTSYPSPTIKWFFTPLGNNVTVAGQASKNGTELTLTSLTHKDDSGIYKCMASNGYDSKTQEMNLDVYEPPSFLTQSPSALNVTVGENVAIDCAAEGVPPPTYRFQFVDDFGIPAVLSNFQLDIKKGLLVIVNIDMSNGGTYTCFADNKAGTISKVIKIAVQPKP